MQKCRIQLPGKQLGQIRFQHDIMKDDKFNYILGFLFLILLVLGPGVILDRGLYHSMPFNYKANDAAVHLGYITWLQEHGAWDVYAPWFSMNYADVVAFNPPILYVASVIFSNATGMPLWDSIYFIVLMFAILGCLAFFLILKRFDKWVALLACPIFLLIFFVKFSLVFTWGTWIFVVGSVILIGFFYYFDHPWLAPILLAGTALCHTPEYIFGVGFLVFYVAYNKGKDWWPHLRTVLISVLISSVYLWIFYNTWMQVTPYHFKVEFASTGFDIGTVTLMDFSLLLIPLAFGLLLLSFNFLKLKEKRLPILIGWYMIGIGLTSLIGFGLRAFQTRLFWPIYLAVFIAYPIYFFIQNLTEDKKRVIVAVAVILLSLGVVLTHQIDKEKSSVFFKDRWDSFQWIKANTAPTAKILNFYSFDTDQKALLWLSERNVYFIEKENLHLLFNGTNLSRYVPVRQIGECKSSYAYLDGLKFKYHWDELNKTDSSLMDLCGFDYYTLSSLNPDPTLTELHKYISSVFINNNMSVAYNSGGVLILKNEGGNCVG